MSSFVKLLTGAGIQITRAMELTSKLFKLYNTHERLEELNDAKLCELGITRNDERKQILKAVAKPKLGSAKSSKPRKAKRNRDHDLLGDPSAQETEEGSDLTSLDFKEVTDDAQLEIRSTVVNRAPIMTAWAMIVAEKLGFKHEEALSIASAYTELNAISKGTSLGIFGKGKTPASEVMESSSQPHVELMGRRIPLLTGKSGQWRALSSDGTPVPPSSAYSYVSNALKQTTPYIIGAMRMLASTFTPAELNQKGFGLYASFRPQVDSWGGRSTVKCKDILDLRKQPSSGSCSNVEDQQKAPVHKSGLSLEEYEAALEADDFQGVDIG